MQIGLFFRKFLKLLKCFALSKTNGNQNMAAGHRVLLELAVLLKQSLQKIVRILTLDFS